MLQTLHGLAVMLISEDGPPIGGERDATDLIGEAMSTGAELLALPVARLSPEFLTLRTRVAGDMLQKFINYRLRVAIVGDIAAAVEASDALRDFVRESNRGQWVWFVTDMDALAARLAQPER